MLLNIFICVCLSVCLCVLCAVVVCYVGVVVEELDLEELTRQWQWGQMSNYDYIMALNL